MKTINTSQHIIIPKKGDTGLKSQELVENLNSVSTEDIKTIGDEIKKGKEKSEGEENFSIFHDLATKSDEELEQKYGANNAEKSNDIKKYSDEDLKSMLRSGLSLYEIHQRLDKDICKIIYGLIKSFRGSNIVLLNKVKDSLLPIFGSPVDTEINYGRYYILTYEIFGGSFKLHIKFGKTYKNDPSFSIGYDWTYEKSWNSRSSGWPIDISFKDDSGYFNNDNFSDEIYIAKKKLYDYLVNSYENN